MKPGDVALWLLAGAGAYFLFKRSNAIPQTQQYVPFYVNGYPWGGYEGPDVITVNVPPTPVPVPPTPDPTPPTP